MENAVDALKIAFAVMVFTMALTLAISTFSQARETSEAVLYMNDKTNYYLWEDEVNYSEDKRIVGIEEIIPTLYRYYKENYTVIFVLDGYGTKLPIYNVKVEYKPDGTKKSEKWLVPDSGISGETVNYFDLNSEIKANCPWVGTVNDIKKNLDLFLDGTSHIGISELDKKSFGNTARYVKYEYGTLNKGFIEAYKNDKFLEELGEYSTDRTYGMNNGFLEVQDEYAKIAKFEQVGNVWRCVQGNNDFAVGDSKLLQDIATKVGNSASAFLDQESGEIIELAKPTIKRVIKYTKLP